MASEQDEKKRDDILKKMLQTPPTPNKPLKAKDSDKKGDNGLSSAAPLSTKRT